MSTKQAVSSLYRRSLKLSLDWAVHRYLWRGQALYISGKALFQEAEGLLEAWKHPDPYHAPTAPGGSKFERNLPAPILTPPTEFVK
ncbi:uncharacterized protein L3040_003673 [Drepanopeziza brunnea f. sp. 'multigermtubi']|uniref:uncharacterized protein n=1 Tax=Drepanopeziza brunnea f. sp. 'multigermtubi' TaxID=698441 RepID=UPI00239CA531|nr:hypothetical protein L3040_003673 [Drepanopeziza brunnea f. sp. 'multigermtubi']